ncbi:MAG: M1 family metallopeptidase [Candidatus Saccharimonadales bacterium]
MSKNVIRLFEQFHPERYNLILSPDPETMRFSGTVTVVGQKVGRPSKRLTFHQKALKITKATITKHDKKGDQTLTISRINNQDSFDEVRLHTDEMIYPGSYTVVIEFSGFITRPMNGMYPCFFNQGGKDKKLIATQFESHHAREAFPCIDEPEAKAIFELTLETPLNQTVVSNTPITSQKEVGGALITAFEKTPKMSTYLLAFVFGDMKYLEAKTKNGTVVRTYATPDNVQFTQFALDSAVRTLEFYNEYFDIPYPLPKCDFVALPDFASGAMENWGCITFREQVMLVDAKNTSLNLKQHVANVIAHELTHQWFGNLVTMSWWTDLWLNESFATWMAWLAIDRLFPEWRVWTQFIVEEQSLALKLDALENTHPIEVEVRHPDEIRTIFDAISYEKGASVLLMLHNYLGAKDFRDGLRLYLKKHAYGNTVTTDLWEALSEVSNKPVSKFMGAWTTTSGYPIIHAEVNKDKLSLKQERFYLNPKANKKAATWPIPLLPNAKINRDTIDKESDSLQIKDSGMAVLLNHERSSFARVVYDIKHLENIANEIEEGKVSELDRLGILADAFEASKAGYFDTVSALNLLKSYKHEDSAVVWDVIAGIVASIRIVMDDDALRPGLKKLIREMTSEQLKRLGWEEKSSDSHFDRLLRPTILGLASYGENPSVVEEAKRRFETMKLPEDVHPDIRGVVYGTISRTGGEKEFNKLLDMHNSSTNSEERVTISGALTGFEQPELIKRALAMITTEDVRLQDAPYWIVYSFMNRHARDLTWEWLKSNWEWLLTNLGTDMSFSRMPLYASRGFSDEKFLSEFKKFFEANKSVALERPIKQAIETIEWQSAWKKRDIKQLLSYFKTLE